MNDNPAKPDEEPSNPYASPGNELASPKEFDPLAPAPFGSQIGNDLAVAAILLAINILAGLAITPFALLFAQNNPTFPKFPLPLWLAIHGIIYGVMAAIAIPFGLWLGTRVGLDAPVLRKLVRGDASELNPFRAAWGYALLWGLIGGVAVYAVAKAVPQETIGQNINQEAVKAITSAPPWIPALASVGAGLSEETQFRYGVMALFVWIGCVITDTNRPGQLNVWLSNILATLPFSAMHIANLVAIGGDITPASLGFIFFGNGLIALGFGWLYWRYGIESAMLSHIAVDIVMKVLLPLVW